MGKALTRALEAGRVAAREEAKSGVDGAENMLRVLNALIGGDRDVLRAMAVATVAPVAVNSLVNEAPEEPEHEAFDRLVTELERWPIDDGALRELALGSVTEVLTSFPLLPKVLAYFASGSDQQTAVVRDVERQLRRQRTHFMKNEREDAATDDERNREVAIEFSEHAARAVLRVFDHKRAAGATNYRSKNKRPPDPAGRVLSADELRTRRAASTTELARPENVAARARERKFRSRTTQSKAKRKK